MPASRLDISIAAIRSPRPSRRHISAALERVGPALRHALSRMPAIALAIVALLLVLSGNLPAAYAGNIIVNGTCSLADAMVSANSGVDSGGCTGGTTGADTVVLDVDVILTEIDNSTIGATGLPVITSEITIIGNNHAISRSSDVDFRILAIGSSGNLTLQSTTIRGGRAQTSTNADESSGGGVYNSGRLTLWNSVISGNRAGDVNGGGSGGGIYNIGTLAVQNSTISSNSAYYGGGVYNREGTALVQNSTLSGNSVYSGGGIFDWEGPLTVENSTISDNSASLSGGGIGFISAHTVTVANSTISRNSGGGIFVWGTLAVQKSIVAGQIAGEDCALAMAGVVLSGGNNIESATSCGFTGTGDQQGINPLLDALASNGGPTQTMALQSNSPAIDKIANDTNGCAAGTSADQRGAVRAGGGNWGGTACDIGSYEFQTLELSVEGNVGSSGCSVTLSWNPLPVSEYQVWRSTSAFSGFAVLEDELTSTSFEASLDPSTNYYYEVAALGAFDGDALAASSPVGTFSFGLEPGSTGLWPLAFRGTWWDALYSNGAGCGRELYVVTDAGLDCTMYNCDLNNDGIPEVVPGEEYVWVDFPSSPGDDCAASGCGTAELTCRIRQDFPGSLQFPACLEGVAGVVAGAANAANDRIGDIVAVPLFDMQGCGVGTCGNGHTYQVYGTGRMRVLGSVRLTLAPFGGGRGWSGSAIRAAISCNESCNPPSAP